MVLNRIVWVLLMTLSLLTCGTAGADAGAAPPAAVAHFERMPKPALLPDGTLAAYFLQHRGPGLPATPATQTMRVRYSEDGGRSWSEPRPLFELPAAEGGFGYFVVLVDQAGEVHFLILCDANTGVVRPRPAEAGRPPVEPLDRQRLDVWHVRSTDNRTHWTAPRRIWEGRAGDPQSVIQLRSGRIILPMAYLVERSWRNRGEGFTAYTYTGRFDTTVLYSDDGGETWEQSPSVLRAPTPNLSAYGGVEPVLVQLEDGRVWMLLRTQMGRFYESFSEDGRVWSELRPSSITSSDSPAGLVRLPDGRIVLIWNNCLRYPYAQGARNVLHAAVSDDDGRTWRGYREIARDPHRKAPPPPGGDHGVSYPFPTLTDDGQVLYSLWVESGEGRSLRTFDPAWLEQTTQRDDFSDGLEAWSSFGTRGIEVIEHPQASDGQALSIRRAEADWPSAAVWNFPFGRRGSLRMRVLVEPGFGGALLQLTDHFSVPFDAQDRFFSLFNLPIDAEGDPAPAGQWVDLELRWDMAERRCRVLVDGEQVTALPLRHTSEGPSYLRIRCTSGGVDEGRLLIDSVVVEVEPEA